MSLIKSHSRSTNMSQQLCALTLMALILGYGTFAAPQLVMRPVNQAKEIGYQGKSGLPRPKIRRNTRDTKWIGENVDETLGSDGFMDRLGGM